MPYVFISHASEDKRGAVRPLVEALLLQGIQVWLDRPGHGDSHFDFDDEFIQRHQILSLHSGEDWDRQISHAVAEAGAVVVCLSRSLSAGRQVLVQELLLGSHHRKLVACVVDDLPWSEFPKDLGLTDLSRVQAARVDPVLLRQTVDLVRAGADPAGLEAPLRTQWEIVTSLVRDITRIFNRSGLVSASPEATAAIGKALLGVPIGPMVRAGEIPLEVIALFSDRFGAPDRASHFVAFAMQLRRQCNPEDFDDPQIALRAGELLNPHTVTADDFWADVLTNAGRKSRRTLAALLRAPGAPDNTTTNPAVWGILSRFDRWLENP